jgi:hypothetical protein
MSREGKEAQAYCPHVEGSGTWSQDSRTVGCSERGGGSARRGGGPYPPLTTCGSRCRVSSCPWPWPPGCTRGECGRGLVTTTKHGHGTMLHGVEGCAYKRCKQTRPPARRPIPRRARTNKQLQRAHTHTVTHMQQPGKQTHAGTWRRRTRVKLGLGLEHPLGLLLGVALGIAVAVTAVAVAGVAILVGLHAIPGNSGKGRNHTGQCTRAHQPRSNKRGIRG